MRKGKFGVSYAAYAVLAMFMALLAITSSYTFIIALVGLTLFVIVAERDDWTSRACLEANGIVGLYALYNTVLWIIRKILGIIRDAKYNAYTNYDGNNEKKYEKLAKAYNKFLEFDTKFDFVVGIIDFIVIVALIVLIIMAILKVRNQIDANTPIASKFARWAVGFGAAPRPQQMPQMSAQMPQMGQMTQNPTGVCPVCGSVVNGPVCPNCGNRVQ